MFARWYPWSVGPSDDVLVYPVRRKQADVTINCDLTWVKATQGGQVCERVHDAPKKKRDTLLHEGYTHLLSIFATKSGEMNCMTLACEPRNRKMNDVSSVDASCL